MDIKSLIRKNIADLAPYSTARDEYTGDIGIYLDANENPYDNGYNRYPDPYQKKLKERIADIKGISAQQLFIGNGSDEAIDLLYRAFCEPGIHNALAIAPSYGMYKVAANINNVALKETELDKDFLLNAEKLLNATDNNTRLILLCSPNNPSGNLLDVNEIWKILGKFNGIVVVDEAYIDFAEAPSLVKLLPEYPNLVILQTLSKAWGLAGLRLGLAIADPAIINIFTKIKYPYNINIVTQALVLEQLQDTTKTKQQIDQIITQREWLSKELENIACVKKVYPSDANFILAEVTDANEVYNQLINNKIIVRNRHKVIKCNNCLRITVGTADENKRLINKLKEIQL